MVTAIHSMQLNWSNILRATGEKDNRRGNHQDQDTRKWQWKWHLYNGVKQINVNCSDLEYVMTAAHFSLNSVDNSSLCQKWSSIFVSVILLRQTRRTKKTKKKSKFTNNFYCLYGLTNIRHTIRIVWFPIIVFQFLKIWNWSFYWMKCKGIILLLLIWLLLKFFHCVLHKNRTNIPNRTNAILALT